MDAAGWLRKQLEDAHPDLLRAMVKEFAEALMSADADAVCGGGYGERSPERVNRRNGYRERGWDTRVGSVEVPVPKAQGGLVLPRLAAAAAPQGGAGVRVGDRRCLPRRLLDPTGREAGAAARRRADVEEPGLAASEEPRGAARVAAPSTSASCAPSASTVTASLRRSA